jgi:hypothetical protein
MSNPRLFSSVRTGLVLMVPMVLGLVMADGPAFAQMQRSVLESLTVSPPPHPFNINQNFASVGAFDVEVLGGYAVNANNQNADDPQNAAYMQYAAPAGSAIMVLPSFPDPIPAPTSSTDACHHAHLEWAVYLFGIRWINIGSARLPFITTQLQSSTGELGRRLDANGNQVLDKTPGSTCAVTSAPDQIYTSFNGVFDFGPLAAFINIGTVNDFQILSGIVAAQAVSHGWGSCGNFLCFQNIRMAAFRTK